MDLSSERYASREMKPQMARFCRLVEETPKKFDWAKDDTDNLEFGTSFSTELWVKDESMIFRCGTLNGGSIHRMVIDIRGTRWDFDMHSGDSGIRVQSLELEDDGDDATYSLIELDEIELKKYLDEVCEGLESKRIMGEFDAIASLLEQAEIDELEAILNLPS